MVLCSSAVKAGWYEVNTTLMGTDIHVSAWHQDDQKATAAVQDTLAEMRRINALMSSYEESSELSLLNREAGQHATAVSDELLQLISRSLEISKRTHGGIRRYLRLGWILVRLSCWH